MNKILVLYYSYEGNTKKIAELIAKELNADIEEVKPIKEMQAKGFGKYFWGGGQVIMKKKPSIKSMILNPAEYDIVILGTPVWASNYAPPIKTILEDGFLKNKKVALFYTHLGGPGKTEQNAKAVISQDNEFLGALSCQKVAKEFDSLKPKVIEWAKNMSTV